MYSVGHCAELKEVQASNGADIHREDNIAKMDAGDDSNANEGGLCCHCTMVEQECIAKYL